MFVSRLKRTAAPFLYMFLCTMPNIDSKQVYSTSSFIVLNLKIRTTFTNSTRNNDIPYTEVSLIHILTRDVVISRVYSYFFNS